MAVYREFGPANHPGTVFLLGQGLLEVSGHAAGPAGGSVMIWIQVRDVRAEHARLAAAGVPVIREPVTEPWGLAEMDHPGNLGGSDSWKDAGPWRHRGSTRRSSASAR